MKDPLYRDERWHQYLRKIEYAEFPELTWERFLATEYPSNASRYPSNQAKFDERRQMNRELQRQARSNGY